jgi:hypothetical protein
MLTFISLPANTQGSMKDCKMQNANCKMKNEEADEPPFFICILHCYFAFDFFFVHDARIAPACDAVRH